MLSRDEKRDTGQSLVTSENQQSILDEFDVEGWNPDENNVSVIVNGKYAIGFPRGRRYSFDGCHKAHQAVAC